MSLYATFSGNNRGGSGGGGGGSGVVVYANLAAFPASAPNGTLAVAGDTNILYEYSTGAVAWQPIASNASYLSSGSPYFVNLFTLSPTDITNKFVTLSQAPNAAGNTILSVIGGPMQGYGSDFTVSGSTLSWSGLFLDGVLTAGDKLVIQFD